MNKQQFINYIRVQQKIIMDQIGNNNQSRFKFAQTKSGPNTQKNSGNRDDDNNGNGTASVQSNLNPRAPKFVWRGPRLPNPQNPPK